MKRKALNHTNSRIKRVFPSEEKRQAEVHALLTAWRQAILSADIEEIKAIYTTRLTQLVRYGPMPGHLIVNARLSDLGFPSDSPEKGLKLYTVRYYTLYLALKSKSRAVVEKLYAIMFPWRVTNIRKFWAILKGAFSHPDDPEVDPEGREALITFLNNFPPSHICNLMCRLSKEFFEDESSRDYTAAQRMVSIWKCVTEDCGVGSTVFLEYASQDSFYIDREGQVGERRCFSFFKRICDSWNYNRICVSRAELLLVEWIFNFLMRCSKAKEDLRQAFYDCAYGRASLHKQEMEAYVKQHHGSVPASHRLSKGNVLLHRGEMMPIREGHVPSLFWKAVLQVGLNWNRFSLEQKAEFAYHIDDIHVRKELISFRQPLNASRADAMEEFRYLDFINAVGQYIYSESEGEEEGEEDPLPEPKLDIPPL